MDEIRGVNPRDAVEIAMAAKIYALIMGRQEAMEFAKALLRELENTPESNASN